MLFGFPPFMLSGLTPGDQDAENDRVIADALAGTPFAAIFAESQSHARARAALAAESSRKFERAMAQCRMPLMTREASAAHPPINTRPTPGPANSAPLSFREAMEAPLSVLAERLRDQPKAARAASTQLSPAAAAAVARTVSSATGRPAGVDMSTTNTTNNTGAASDSEKAVMKATGKSLQQIRTAQAAWDAASPDGQGVFITPSSTSAKPSQPAAGRPELAITDAHRAVARATGKTPEQVAAASAAGY